MPSEYYNSPGRYKPGRKKHGVYKPRGKRGLPVFVRVIIAIAAVGLLTLGVLFVIPGVGGGSFSLFRAKDDTPVATPTPAPTAHPIENANTDSLIRDIAITDTNFQWFADMNVYGDTLMFCGGEIVDGDAYMTGLFSVSTDENAPRTAKRTNIILENDHIMYPCFNDNWLVYLDAKASSGGKIMCSPYSGESSEAFLVKEVYTGHPALFLSGNYLAWTERTGTSMDKLYIYDLTTRESATVQMFNKTTYYGVSKPHLSGKQLVWADVDTENSTGSMTSQICIMNTESGEFLSYKPGTYAHDPKSNGDKYIAWITGNHGTDSELYISYDMGEAEKIAEGVVDFYMDENYLAYQKDEMVYVYIFSTKAQYRVSKSGQCVQLIGASGGCVMWSDVSSRMREVPQYIVIPE